MSNREVVIVVGGGFAGLNFIKDLDPKKFEVLLIDKLNYHQFQPLLYQVATSQLEPSSISFPLRHIFKTMQNVKIRLSEVSSIDPDKKNVNTPIGSFKYDHLILAMGCKTNFFNNVQIEKNAFPIKTTYEAITIRNHILQVFEDIISSDQNELEALQNIIIVGGGPTGVELAGAFAEIKKNVLPRDYHRIDFSKLKIILIEGSPNTLNNMSQVAKSASAEYLEAMGVTIKLNTIVKSYDGLDLVLNSGEIIKSKTVIWAAGVTPNTVDGLPVDVIAPNKRLKVNRFNQVEQMPNIYALGDVALMSTPKYANGHPQVANVAIGQAKNLAHNFNKGFTKEYEYKDLGSMATLAKNKAVVDLPFIKFKGFFAWVVWMFLHLMLILSIRKKLIIFINWAWAYVNKDTALRLILRDNKKA